MSKEDIKRMQQLSGIRGLFETDDSEFDMELDGVDSDIDDEIDLDAEDSLVVGKHNDMADEEFDADELAMGVDVEMKHTDDPNIAKALAKDNLAETPDYYTRLAGMMDMDDETDLDGEEDDMDMDGEEGEGDMDDLGAGV